MPAPGKPPAGCAEATASDAGVRGPGGGVHLTADHRGAGHDGDASRILMAPRGDLHARGHIGSRPAAFIYFLWGALAGYGYRAGRLALVLLAVLAIAGGLGLLAWHTATTSGHYAAEYTANPSHPGTPCSAWNRSGWASTAVYPWPLQVFGTAAT